MADQAEATRRRAAERLGASARLGNPRLDRLVRLAQQTIGVPIAFVSVLDGPDLTYPAVVGMDSTPVPRTETVCDTVIRHEAPLTIEDLAADRRFAQLPGVVGSPGARGYAGRPLVDADGIAVGTFCIVDTAPRSFTDDQLELLAELADWVRQEVIDSQESAAAATVQQRLLPSRLPALQGWDLAACCVPSRNIGGDFFDWQMVDGAASLVVADVMGKGTAAALLSATVRASLRAALRATAAHRSSDATALLTDALAEGAAAVQRDLTETGTLVTAFVAHLDTNGETLTWIDAGHGLAVLCHADGTHDWLRSGDMPLGVLADSTWRAAQTALRPGDRAVIVSDGLLDLLGGTAEALQALPVWAASARSADDLIADAKRLCAERIATDDVTVVIATPQ